MAEEYDQVSLFTSRIESCRLDEPTLRILELIVSSSSLQIRTTLINYLDSHSLAFLRQASGYSIQFKLLILEFFVRAFAILGHFQSCLSLRYEGLVLRDSTAAAHPHFQVSHHEWLNFARDAFQHAFYPVAAKACQNALSCVNTNLDSTFDNARTIDEIQRLMNLAIALSSNHSVQAQGAEYLKKKTLSLKQSSSSKEAECPASISFKTGIKLHNARNLMRLKNQ